MPIETVSNNSPIFETDPAFNPFAQFDIRTDEQASQPDIDHHPGWHTRSYSHAEWMDRSPPKTTRPGFKRTASEGVTEWEHPLAGLDADDDSEGSSHPNIDRIPSYASPLQSVSDPADVGHDSNLGVDFTAEGGSADTEKTVLVHVISPHDSLAGVSLKYNISPAALRRANHLWTSDSIHLRSVLYIPIPDGRSPIPQADTNGHTQPHNETIRRIPASQLSFFPPPTKPQPIPPPVPPQLPHSSSPVSRPSAFSTMITSTRDIIASRLSLDSSRSEGSDEHELTNIDVRRPTSMDAEFPHRDTITSRRNGAHHRSITDGALYEPSPQPPPPPKDIPPSPQKSVRTRQLEPSPRMTLPALRSGPTIQP